MSKEKEKPSLREFRLMVTDSKGKQFPDKVLEEIKEEQEFIEDSEFGDEMPEEMVFRINRRGKVYDHLKMAIGIMEAPPPSKQGISRKQGKNIDSLLDKLYVADDAEDRPDTVLLEEGEWKHLKERADEHDFPNRNRATRRFQDNVIEETKKVPVVKAPSEPEDKKQPEEK